MGKRFRARKAFLGSFIAFEMSYVYICIYYICHMHFILYISRPHNGLFKLGDRALSKQRSLQEAFKGVFPEGFQDRVGAI